MKKKQKLEMLSGVQLQFAFSIRTEVFKNFLGGFEDNILNIGVTQNLGIKPGVLVNLDHLVQIRLDLKGLNPPFADLDLPYYSLFNFI